MYFQERDATPHQIETNAFKTFATSASFLIREWISSMMTSFPTGQKFFAMIDINFLRGKSFKQNNNSFSEIVWASHKLLPI